MLIDKKELEDLSRSHLQSTYDKFELEYKDILNKINDKIKQDILDVQVYCDLYSIVKKETYRFKQQLYNYLKHCGLNVYFTRTYHPVEDFNSIKIELEDFYNNAIKIWNKSK